MSYHVLRLFYLKYIHVLQYIDSVEVSSFAILLMYRNC
jgi:hypothetical protein